MDFIMHVCKKSEPDFTVSDIIFVSILIFSVSVHAFAQSSGIMIKQIYGSANQTTLNINANISYQLSKETRDALNHGVPLEFDIEVRVKKHRKWIWDETIITKIITHRVEYQPLSGQYLVTEIQSGSLEQFQNLEEVLSFIGELESFPLIGIDMISPEHDYVAQIKSQLNIQALPAPLRPLAYISSQWHLASSWQSWAIQL